MNAAGAIFKREFMGYFRTPVAYVFLVISVLSSIGLPWFLGGFFDSNNASLDIFFNYMPWAFLLLIPAAGMRLWAEEKRMGTWELLLTLPIKTWQCVLAKFLAGWAFVTLGIALTFTMPLTVGYLGDPDWGPIVSGYFGSILMAGSYMAIASLTSSITKSQVVSMVLSVSICMVLILLGWDIFSNLLLSLHFPVSIIDAIANFSFLTHFKPMIQGLITLKDVVFFLSIIGFCLALNVITIDR